jgi:hypothetical protein
MKMESLDTTRDCSSRPGRGIAKKVLSAGLGVALAASLLTSASVMAAGPQMAPVLGDNDPNTAGFCPGNGIECVTLGSSKLKRSKRGVTMTVNTSGLEAGAVYTIWWVIFNNPGECFEGCNGADLSNPDVNGTVMWAAGHPIGGSGVGNFAAHLSEGEITNLHPVDFPGDADGMQDAKTAEIHLVVRNHGPAIPELMYEMMSTFDGACDINVCDDEQFAIHLP